MKWISFFLAMSALFLNTAFGVYKHESSLSFTPASTQVTGNAPTLIEIEIVYQDTATETWLAPKEVPVLLSETLEVLGIMAPEQLSASVRSELMCLEPRFCFDLDCRDSGAVTIAFHQGGIESTGITYLD